MSLGSTLDFFIKPVPLSPVSIHRAVFESVTHQIVTRSSDLLLVSDS